MKLRFCHILLGFVLLRASVLQAQIRWFEIEDVDSTQWGWNLTRHIENAFCLSNETGENGPSFEFIFVATDTLSVDSLGRDITFKGFFMTTTEITQRQWILVMGAPNPQWRWRDDNLPATHVTPSMALEFCRRIDSIQGTQWYRLPTDKEWFFAAQGGHYSDQYRYFGSNNPHHIGWYQSNSNRQPHPVAQKVANELDLYDMGGNVSEIVLNSATPKRSYLALGGNYSQSEEWMQLRPSDAPVMSAYSSPMVGFRIVFDWTYHIFDYGLMSN